MKALEHNRLYEFGRFRLDPRRRALFDGDGQPVLIAPQAFDALCVLVAHRGELIDKSTLMTALWPHVVVEDNSLNQCISALRRALGEQPGALRFVATIPGRGYRFVADVAVREREATPGDAQVADADLDLSSRRGHMRSTHDPHAYELFLQGQSFLTHPNARNLKHAAELFSEAIARDAHFARAHLGLAHTHQLSVVFQVGTPDSLTRCEQSARQALALDPKLAQGHAVLGALDAHRGKWQDAERQFNEALHRDARDPQVVIPYVMYLRITPGYLRQAHDALRETLALSPSLAGLPSTLAMVAMLRGLDAEARRYADLAITLGWSRGLGPISDCLSQLAVRAGHFDEACAIILHDRGVAAADASAATHLVFEALSNASLRASAVSALQALERRVAAQDLDRPMRQRLLLWYTQLGALDAAFETANRSLDHFATLGTVGTVWGVLWMPETAAFRADARFHAFAERLGLPVYWAIHGSPDAL
ncbi:MAG: winged helix-turn-helix domain-containing protein [Gammaproteobacteria bacterium]